LTEEKRREKMHSDIANARKQTRDENQVKTKGAAAQRFMHKPRRENHVAFPVSSFVRPAARAGARRYRVAVRRRRAGEPR